MRSRRRWTLAIVTVLTAVSALVPTPSAVGSTSLYHEQYRPQFHFTPAQNWMNDPNGPIYVHGTYHLFFQYNPAGTTWGNISWGHAVSTDLVHWKQLPLAIPDDEREYIFSGGVVYDEHNTSGLGTAANPPLVAVYTSALKNEPIQQQSLAYSLDDGLTWTKYAGNPVLNLGLADFRDPKVFWYPQTRRWVMAVALPTRHQVSIYTSTDLTSWTRESDFGPAGATGGAWECPNLFPVQVKGTNQTKWVLVVGINPGAPAGGSGDQYFVGSFDGRTFTSDEPTTYTPPAETLIGDGSFEGGDYGDWTAAGAAFGTGPAHADTPTNGAVANGWVDSYGTGDADTGTLTSPTFTIDQAYLNFLIAGGNHPYGSGAETGANLLVDGRVVRSATGANSPNLDWAGWDVRDLRGKRAQVQIVDANSGTDWGHTIADHFGLAAAPARSSTERAHWVDDGADFYAATVFNDLPNQRQVLVGWMNNWNYANDIPTAPWRSATNIPREVVLDRVGGRLQLITTPVSELSSLYVRNPKSWSPAPIGGTKPAGIKGNTLDLDLTLAPGSARQFGVDVHVGNGQRTRIGYDRDTGTVFIDRTRSGDTSFNPAFGGVQSAPLPLRHGQLHLRVIVDTSSVEVFADKYQVALSDQVFPDPTSTGVDLFAVGGTATLLGGTGHHVRSIWR